MQAGRKVEKQREHVELHYLDRRIELELGRLRDARLHPLDAAVLGCLEKGKAFENRREDTQCIVAARVGDVLQRADILQGAGIGGASHFQVECGLEQAEGVVPLYVLESELALVMCTRSRQ